MAEESITEEEKVIYDRQIRLWGLEAQNRLRNSRVLIAGLTGCGAEIAKDLMLAGLKSLTLLDDQKVTEDDVYNQFLITNDSVGKNRAEASRARCQFLNPNVNLFIDQNDLDSKDETFFKGFDLVILVDKKYSLIEKINRLCRKINVRFQAAGVFGWIGYGFFDFNEFTFLVKPRKDLSVCTVDVDVEEDDLCAGPSVKKARHHNLINGTSGSTDITIENDEDEKIKEKIAFSSWSSAMNVDWSHKRLIRQAKRILPNSYFQIRALLRAYDSLSEVNIDVIVKLWEEEMKNCGRVASGGDCSEAEALFFLGPQLSPACAIVGAVIAQEAIKALSQNELPLQNLFLYSAYNTSGVVCTLPPDV